MMMFGLCLALALPQSGELQGIAEDSLHRVATLELGAEGASVQHAVDFGGSLSIWARSDTLDPRLTVEVLRGERLLEDDDAGGGTTAWLSVEVEPGDALKIVVLAADVAAGSPAMVELHVVGASESDATRTAADRATEELGQIERLKNKGALEEARALVAALADELASVPGASTSHLVGDALLRAGNAAYDLSALEPADKALAAAHAARARLLPPDHSELLASKHSLALARKALGDLAGARELQETVLEAWTRLLPRDDLNLLSAKENLASTRAALGDAAGARALLETVLETLSRVLPPDHPDLLATQMNLATVRYELRDGAGARDLLDIVHEAWTRLPPPDPSYLLLAKLNLALVRKQLGDFAGARELEEAVLDGLTRLLPPDHPDLLAAKLNLAGTWHALGDIAAANRLFEEVHDIWTNLLPPDHPDLLKTRVNLAVTRAILGDHAGAKELFERVLDVWSNLLPPDHPDLLETRLNLAGVLLVLGDLSGARELLEAVLEARERFLPPEHPDLVMVKMNLASTRYMLEDPAGANELLVAVNDVWTRLLPADHPDLLRAKQNLAATRYALGDLAGARELLEVAHEGWTRLLPPDHPEVLAAKLNLVMARQRLGDLAGAREMLSSLLECARLRAHTLRSEAARPAREGARADLRLLSRALSLELAVDSASSLDAEFFASIESMRLASVASAETAHAVAARPELAGLARIVREARARLNDFVAGGPEGEETVEAWRRSFVDLAGERDSAERELMRKLSEVGVFAGEVDARSVAAKLENGSAAVSYLRCSSDRSFEKGEKSGADVLLAFVVTSEGVVRRLDLGPTAELEELVQGWRGAIGVPLQARGVGVAVAGSEVQARHEVGARLRARVLDPVLAEAGDVHTLHVVLDDFLHLVPLDALPLEDGLLGERLTILNEVTLARLLWPRREVAAEGGMTIAGGIDYDAELASDALAQLDAAAPPVDAGALRSGPGATGLAYLPGTRSEAEAIAALYQEVFGREARVLAGRSATKAALYAAAPMARFLHLATHGWFANEAFESQLDPLDEPATLVSWRKAEESLRGFAPESRCGLGLACANHGRDEFRRVPGILTAEELLAFDLRNCELAVLSACETNVGIRRAGQGIQSLQTALHAAGARAAITSLWRVDDAATRRLFEIFYTKLWKDGLAVHEALWRAKMALRAEGHPTRDWAAWVLSGNPR